MYSEMVNFLDSYDRGDKIEHSGVVWNPNIKVQTNFKLYVYPNDELNVYVQDPPMGMHIIYRHAIRKEYRRLKEEYRL